MTKASDLIKEITGLVEEEGWKVFGVTVRDYDITVKLHIKKDGKKRTLPLREVFYDTDEDGRRTKVHGIVDIRESPWYQKKKRAG